MMTLLVCVGWIVFGVVAIPILFSGAIAVWLSRKIDWYVVAWWWVSSTLIYLVGIPITLAGLLVVAIALPQRRVIGSPVQFTQHPPGFWVDTHLPGWAILWDNPVDGLVGDRRGAFADWCRRHWIGVNSVLAMYIWTAIRNPANYWSRVVTGVEVTFARVETVKQGSGWYLLRATEPGGLEVLLFKASIPYPFFRKRGVYARFGWKIELNDEVSPDLPIVDRMRGSVYKMSLWKDMS